MHRHFVRPAGLLGFFGFLGFVGMSQPTSPPMAVRKLEGGEEGGAERLDGGEGDGADNRLGFTMYKMKMSLGSSDSWRREAIRTRPSWFLLPSKRQVLAQAETPSIAVPGEEEAWGGEEGYAERWRRFEAAMGKRREVFRIYRKLLDKLQGLDNRHWAKMYKMKRKSLGSPESWRLFKDALGRRREIIDTWRGCLDELEGLEESLEAVTREQVKTTPRSSYYHDLAQRKNQLLQQESVCLDNHERIIEEYNRIYRETNLQINEVLFGIEESTSLDVYDK